MTFKTVHQYYRWLILHNDAADEIVADTHHRVDHICEFGPDEIIEIANRDGYHVSYHDRGYLLTRTRRVFGTSRVQVVERELRAWSGEYMRESQDEELDQS